MMNDALREKCDLFLENIVSMQQAFWYENSELRLCAAAMLAMAGKKTSAEELKNMKRILVERVGAFNNLRSYVKLPVIAAMCASDDPSGYCDRLIANYDAVKAGHITRSVFDALAAMVLTDAAKEREVDVSAAVEKMKLIYREMRNNHPLLTGREDMACVALLALSGKEIFEAVGDMEDCYRRLKPDFALRGDYVQTMSAVLTLMGGENSDKCDRLVKILRALKERGHSLNHSSFLPVAAGLTAIDGEIGDIADSVANASDYLEGKKGFRLSGRWKRTAYGIMMLMSTVPEQGNAGSMLSLSVIANEIISQVMTTVVIISATTAAHSSSSSNG